MAIYGYNYPWSGRLGRIVTCCIYCGDSGPSFDFSSHGNRCVNCCSRDEPIPELKKKFHEEYERLAKLWCDARDIDYEATVKNYLDHLGPIQQERDDPIPGSENDYTIKKGKNVK